MSRNIYWDVDEMVLPMVYYDTAQFATLGKRSLFYDILISEIPVEPISHSFSSSSV